MLDRRFTAGNEPAASVVKVHTLFNANAVPVAFFAPVVIVAVTTVPVGRVLAGVKVTVLVSEL